MNVLLASLSALRGVGPMPRKVWRWVLAVIFVGTMWWVAEIRRLDEEPPTSGSIPHAATRSAPHSPNVRTAEATSDFDDIAGGGEQRRRWLRSVSDSVRNVSLSQSWGYAAERNELRWHLIRESLLQHPPPSWIDTECEEPRQPLRRQRRQWSVLDLGADQGYFTLSVLYLMHAVALHQQQQHCHSRNASGRATASLHLSALAVEKGGFGGAFWHRDAFSKNKETVLDVIRRQSVQLLLRLRSDTRSKSVIDDTIVSSKESSKASPKEETTVVDASVAICPTTINLSFVETKLFPGVERGGGSSVVLESPESATSGRCRPTVALALSMLHWVDGVDGLPGLTRMLCRMVASAEVTFVELPHPAARKTFGEKRYRGWYGRESNVTRLLERVMDACAEQWAQRKMIASEQQQTLASQRPTATGASQWRQRNPCTFRATLVGSTPWGRGLKREVHRLEGSSECHRIATMLENARTSTGGEEGCEAVLQCDRVKLGLPAG